MPKHFKKIDDLPIIENLYEYLEGMIDDGRIQIPKNNQICLNAPPGFEDDYSLGTGSLYLDWVKVDVEKLQTERQIPKKDKVYEEHDFTNLCTVFKNTPFEEIYNSLKNKYNLGRVRLMISLPKTCLSWHVDSSSRLHYPIKTQEGCFMVIEDEVCHLPKNQWTLTNTVIKHTAFNGSFEKRIHLVASILEDYEN